jgi:hypothetical protein
VLRKDTAGRRSVELSHLVEGGGAFLSAAPPLEDCHSRPRSGTQKLKA